MPSKACAVLDIYKDSVLITRAALACRPQRACAAATLRIPHRRRSLNHHEGPRLLGQY